MNGEPLASWRGLVGPSKEWIKTLYLEENRTTVEIVQRHTGQHAYVTSVQRETHEDMGEHVRAYMGCKQRDLSEHQNVPDLGMDPQIFAHKRS